MNWDLPSVSYRPRLSEHDDEPIHRATAMRQFLAATAGDRYPRCPVDRRALVVESDTIMACPACAYRLTIARSQALPWWKVVWIRLFHHEVEAR